MHNISKESLKNLGNKVASLLLIIVATLIKPQKRGRIFHDE